MKTKAYAELKLCCKNRNLIELDNITGLSHTKYHEIGFISVSGIKLDYSSWYYRTKKIEIYYSEEITDILYAALLPSIGKLEKFVDNYNCQVFITVIFSAISEVLPSLTLNRNIISILEKLKGTFAFDGL